LASDACSRPPITIISHDLYVGDTRRVVGETVCTTRGINSLPFFGSYELYVLWPSLFVSPVMVSAIDLLLDFCGCLMSRPQRTIDQILTLIQTWNLQTLRFGLAEIVISLTTLQFNMFFGL
jgi:hypothetical protein